VAATRIPLTEFPLSVRACQAWLGGITLVCIIVGGVWFSGAQSPHAALCTGDAAWSGEKLLVPFVGVKSLPWPPSPPVQGCSVESLRHALAALVADPQGTSLADSLLLPGMTYRLARAPRGIEGFELTGVSAPRIADGADESGSKTDSMTLALARLCNYRHLFAMLDSTNRTEQLEWSEDHDDLVTEARLDSILSKHWGSSVRWLESQMPYAVAVTDSTELRIHCYETVGQSTKARALHEQVLISPRRRGSGS
jgi:hypothetical protein